MDGGGGGGGRLAGRGERREVYVEPSSSAYPLSLVISVMQSLGGKKYSPGRM